MPIFPPQPAAIESPLHDSPHDMHGVGRSAAGRAMMARAALLSVPVAAVIWVGILALFLG
ncbi:hypothetical protein PQ455_00025 [Sphingomonas naphthae]|uniref:Uncharacterized protein n=1 Tax=Sphingomonas naphthae TaxID=1813468 RepID=A0ABY7TKC3_9SPHN|nr:hypothetical protein [Sphingomonas naphthae]WCT73655.1 hypothetical protein PQ455_00025 [Sphingomonas naphthae]